MVAFGRVRGDRLVYRPGVDPAVAAGDQAGQDLGFGSGQGGVTEDQLREAHQRDLDVEAAEGVHFERAWLDPESGMVFCLSTGPSKEAVRRVHEKAGHPADEIYELPVEV